MITDLIGLRGRTVIVTGAGGAIGSTVASTLAEAGGAMVLVERDRARLDAVAARLRRAGNDHLAIAADSCDEEDFRRVVQAATERFGAIDGLMCLVGGVEAEEFGPMLTAGIRTYDAMMDRNLRSAVVAHQVTAEAMVSSGRGGSVVSIAAATALASSPFHALYGAAKAALVALARTEAVEWGPLGIRVNTVAPGAVETRPAADPEEVARWERAAIPLGRRVRPVEIAAAALFLLSDLSSAVTGQTLVLDGGALAKPAFFDADNVPVFVTDASLRARMRGTPPGSVTG
jgi:NAD(P)-dependent dehydrogenase (short-subunit alcohol dehydrogenase family)